VTDPDTPSDVPDADRAEREALLDPRPDEASGPLRPVGDREASEADLIDQELDVPLDDDGPV
jgi:hypothetical protein